MGKVANIQTKPTDAGAEAFLAAVQDEQQREDSFTILKIMEKASGEPPVMWGASIIGFGHKRYKSERSGREVDWFKIGFSPRKANISLYLTVDIKTQAAALQKLGKHKTGVGCLYINKLADIDLNVLESMIVDAMKNK
jgi:hypothetical protein